MKKLIILIAIIGLSLGSVLAENVKPSSSAKVSLKSNNYNIVQVAVDKQEGENVRVLIYDNDFSLLHSSKMSKKDVRNFEISSLPAGFYIVKVELDGDVIYTGTVEKTK